MIYMKVRYMARLIYSMLMSLDGYTEDAHGDFGWGAPEDEAVHSYVNELASSIGTYLYGRRMYETMVYLEGVRLDLELVEERPFGNGVVVLRYAVRG